MRIIRYFFACAVLFTTATAAHAMVAGEVEDLQVTGHFFSTHLADGRTTQTIKDAKISRFVVLRLAGGFRRAEERVFINDFVLRYLNRNTEDRSQCVAIGSDDPESGLQLRVGAYASLTLKQGRRPFYIGCPIEEGVSQVEIMRFGAPSIHYNIGLDRQFSVWLTTNRGKPALDQFLPVVRAAGLSVNASDQLVRSFRGVQIQYSPLAETAARELSQRFMSSLGVTANLKSKEVAGEHDLVVWVGE